MAYFKQRGKKKFYTAIYYYNGLRKTISTHTSNKHEAERIYRETIKRQEEGTYSQNKKISFEEFAKLWLENQNTPDKKASTIASYKDVINIYLLPYFKDKLLKSIEPLNIEKFKVELSKKVSITTVNYALRILRSMFENAIILGYLNRNPAKMVKKLKPVKHNRPGVSKEDILKLQEVIEPEHKALIFTGILLGGRIGELSAMRWQNLDWEKGLYTIKESYTRYGFSTPKTETSYRTVYLPPTLLQMLKEHKLRQNEKRLLMGSSYKNQDLIFATSIGTPYNASNIRTRIFKPVLKKAGLLSSLRFHDLRSVYISLSLEAGVPIKMIMDQVGHKDPSVTLSIYAKVTESGRKEAIQKLETYLFACNNRTQGNLTSINEISALS